MKHGRLIDVDALEEKVEHDYHHKKINRYDRDLLLHYLDVEMAPAIEPEPQWIPCHDPSDLPKDKRIWITYECDVCGYVFRFVKDVVWGMTEWSDNVSGVVAYMPYVEPEPYEESGRKE